MSEERGRLAIGLREQAKWCRELGSPLYESLLRQAAEDVESSGPCWRVLEGNEREDDTRGWVLALRFMGAVHRLVLEGRAGELARYYPSMGGTEPVAEACPHSKRLLTHTVQLFAS